MALLLIGTRLEEERKRERGGDYLFAIMAVGQKGSMPINAGDQTTIITRNSSGDEIANVNFLYDDIVHALKMQ